MLSEAPGRSVQAVGRAREWGFAVVDEEFEPDLIGVAVPVRGVRGSIVASLNVSALRHRFVERVQGAAGELSRALVDPGDGP